MGASHTKALPGKPKLQEKIVLVLYNMFDTDETVSSESLNDALLFLRKCFTGRDLKFDIFFASSHYATMDELLQFMKRHGLSSVVSNLALIRNGKIDVYQSGNTTTMNQSDSDNKLDKLIELIDASYTWIFYTDTNEMTEQDTHKIVPLHSLSFDFEDNIDTTPSTNQTNVIQTKMKRPKPSSIVQHVLAEAYGKRQVSYQFKPPKDRSKRLNILFAHNVVEPRLSLDFHILSSSQISEKEYFNTKLYSDFFRTRNLVLPVTLSIDEQLSYFEVIKTQFSTYRSLRNLWLVMEIDDIKSVYKSVKDEAGDIQMASLKDLTGLKGLTIVQIQWGMRETIPLYFANVHHYASDYKNVPHTIPSDEHNTCGVYMIASSSPEECVCMDLKKTARAIRTLACPTLSYIDEEKTRFGSTAGENSILTAMLLYSETSRT